MGSKKYEEALDKSDEVEIPDGVENTVSCKSQCVPFLYLSNLTFDFNTE